MRIACCQFDIAWEDRSANHRRVDELLTHAALPEVTLALLPEMFASGFSMNVTAIHEGEDLPSTAFVAGLAKRLKINIVAGIVARAGDGRGQNRAIAVDSAGLILTTYQKIHPFGFAGEDRFFEPGERLAKFSLEGITFCPLICYDLRFPETFREGIAGGAECFAVIANWPAEREDHWITLLRARAIENQAYVAGVNRCGQDPGHRYSGRSLIFDPRGNIVADAGNGEGIISAEIDIEALRHYRETFPVLRDIRPADLPPLP